MSEFADLCLATDTPRKMTVKHPITGAPLLFDDGTPAWISLLSSDSGKWRAVALEQRNRQLRMPRSTTADFVEDHANELLAAVTVDWRLCGLSGRPLHLPCTPDQARELYGTPAAAWLREQVDVFVGTRANFLPMLEGRAADG